MKLNPKTMPMSDRNIEHLLTAAQTCDPQVIGYGDVILLCQELQEWRSKPPQEPVALQPLDSNERLLDWLIARVNANEPMPDAKVLALFHALQNREYFQTTCWVDRAALKKLLHALSSPEQPHLIREMQVTRGLPRADGPLNPIDQLIVDMQRASHAST